MSNSTRNTEAQNNGSGNTASHLVVVNRSVCVKKIKNGVKENEDNQN